MIIGWQRVTGCQFCKDCMPQPKHEENYSPIFDNQDEYDCYPTCETCKQEIAGVQLTSDGVEWLNSTGRKADWQSWVDAFKSVGAEFYHAYYVCLGNWGWHCLDCFITEVLKGDKQKIQDFYKDMQAEDPTNNAYLCDVISETTVQYEQYAGELIDVDGVYCKVCGKELYAPLDQDEDSGEISEVERV